MQSTIIIRASSIIIAYNSMPLTRHRYDHSRPLKLLQSREFERLQATDPMFPNHLVPPLQQQLSSSPPLTPLIATVEPIVRSRQQPHLPADYIRISKKFNLPKAETYELTELDFQFLQKHSNANPECERGQAVELMRMIWMFLEKGCKRIGDEIYSEQWVHDFTRQHEISQSQQSTLKKWGSKLFVYWSLRRQEFRFPLYRPVWKQTKNVSPLYLAYQPNQRRRSSLSRHRASLDAGLLFELSRQFQTVREICESVQTRERLKCQQLQLQLFKFYQQLRHLTHLSLNLDWLEYDQSSKHEESINQMAHMPEAASQQESTKTLFQMNQYTPFLPDFFLKNGNKAKQIGYYLEQGQIIGEQGCLGQKEGGNGGEGQFGNKKQRGAQPIKCSEGGQVKSQDRSTLASRVEVPKVRPREDQQRINNFQLNNRLSQHVMDTHLLYPSRLIGRR